VSEVSQVTFEQGYNRLNEIVARLDEDVPIDEMVALLREGKGLEKALRDYLEAKEGELEQIEAGQNLPEYAIVAVAAGERQDEREALSSQAPPAPGGFAPSPDEDMPF